MKDWISSAFRVLLRSWKTPLHIQKTDLYTHVIIKYYHYTTTKYYYQTVIKYYLNIVIEQNALYKDQDY